MVKTASSPRAPRAADRRVGSRIRMRRHLFGLTQEALAAAIGVTFQQIQKYENGMNRIGAGRLEQIADALQCHPAWFFVGRRDPAPAKDEPEQRVDTDLSAFFADKDAPSLVRGFVRLKPAAKRAIVNLIALPLDDARPRRAR